MRPFIYCLTATFLVLAPLARADQLKANNNSNLEQGASWVSGIAPGVADYATWDSTVTVPGNCTNVLGTSVSWGGITIKNPVAPVTINGNTTLTISNGINLANATVDLSLNFGTLNLATNQTWTIATGRTLTTGSATNSGSVNSPNNGNFIITKNGSGTWTTSGTGDNGSTGIIINAGTVNLNKTSSGGTHAVGGPGLTVNNSATAKITGTGGDQIYNGATVTLATGGTFDLNGSSETIASLNGNGVVDTTAAGKAATLTLSNGNSTFGGAIQNSGNGASLILIKAGTGTSTLNGTNSYTGGTTVSSGTLALTTTANLSMPYTNTGGTLTVIANSTTVSLPMNNLTLGNGSPQLTFNFGGFRNVTAPLINDAGNLTLNGNVTVNVQNVLQSGTYVLLQYAGSRIGPGNFVAGTLTTGAMLTDDTVNRKVTLTYTSPLQPRVIIPTLNTNELVVAVATPQQYGAVGDGITDDTAAFQNAINAVYNSGGSGGGVVFVPAGNYAFYGNLNIQTGVTLHGDWKDWTTGSGGMMGTTFKIYGGAGQTNGTPFITMSHSTGVRDINFWYPNQNAASIVGYPFTIQVNEDCVVQNVVLVNSYQGILSTGPSGGHKHILSTIIGSPLYKGIDLDQIFDVCHAEDVRFSPAVWPASMVSNAPAVGGPHAAWMRSNGTAMRLLRVDGEMCIDTFISGYNVGIEANAATNGQPGITFYHGSVSNCATAFLAQDMPTAFGPMFAWFTLDGDIAVNRTNTADDANVMFDHCLIIGRNGTAVNSTGQDWHSWMQFQNCTISNALQLAGPGVFNVVDSTLMGGTQCIISPSATRVAFVGCSFSPTTNIINNGNATNLVMDARTSKSNALPMIQWTNTINNYLSRKPARTNLYVVTDANWGAYGNGINDDTSAIQNALTAAGSAGGGIVYLPAGKYHLSNTLDVPGGVELRGAHEMRHGTGTGTDGHAKGTVLEPYAGQGATNGPVAIALEANSGMLGLTISYETQNSNCIPFPATIQGRGGNVYAIGVCAPNPYYYVDLDTYTCTNHFFDMVDGWAIKTGYHVGNGSSGTIADSHCNWTYWVENYDSQSVLPGSVQAPVLYFTSHQMQMYLMGNCTELMLKDFSIIEHNYMQCVAENGHGPNLTLINNYCDGTIQGFILDAAAQCQITAVNTPMTTFNFTSFSDLNQSTVAVVSTTNFQGSACFISSVLWGGTYLDFVVNGGDVDMEMVHMDTHSFIGSIVNGGVFHLVNNSAYISYSGSSNYPPYNVTFGPNAGMPGDTSEFIGCYAYNGCGIINPIASNNPVNCWGDYALSNSSTLNPNLPVLYNFAPDGMSLFQFTQMFGFTALSPAGIATSNITVTVDGVVVTNLVFNGISTAWNVSYSGLTLNAFHNMVVTVKDNNGAIVSSTTSFDTFSSYNYTFEAEDFDYTSNGAAGLFVDNPQTNAYSGLGSTDGIDCHNGSGGTLAYRPSPGLSTENAGDFMRPAYANGAQDYDVGFNNGGNWGNYTRTFPPGTYNIYMRAASPNGSPATADAASISLVSSGQGTTNQTLSKLGTFTIPNTGDWHKWTWVPLKDSHGNMVQFTGGSMKTLRVTTDNGGYNANFYALIPTSTPPVTLTASVIGGVISISFPTEPGLVYQVEYKNNLNGSNWLPLGETITGNGAVQSIADTLYPNCRFYRALIK